MFYGNVERLIFTYEKKYSYNWGSWFYWLTRR